MWKTRHLPLIIDLIFCGVLLPVMLKLLPIERWIVNDSTFVYLLAGWLYVVYLLNRVWILPSLLRRRRALLGLGLILLTLLVTWLVTRYQMDIPVRPRRAPRGLPRVSLQQQAIWFLYVVVMSFGAAVGLLTELYRQIMAQQVEAFERKKAELALYKAQINPHFLFNSLNTLYGMVISGSERTEEAFADFIDLMHYMYANASQDRIPVRVEAEYLRRYVDLQRLRVPPQTRIEYDYDPDPASSQQDMIAPMLLVTFVENAFKYGVSSVAPGEIRIGLRVRDHRLHFTARNRKVERPGAAPVPGDVGPDGESCGKPAGKLCGETCRVPGGEAQTTVRCTSVADASGVSTSGVGIANCRSRLALLYPGRHELRIDDGAEFFEVELKIDLES